MVAVKELLYNKLSMTKKNNLHHSKKPNANNSSKGLSLDSQPAQPATKSIDGLTDVSKPQLTTIQPYNTASPKQIADNPSSKLEAQIGKPPKTKPRRKKIIKILVLIILLGLMAAGIYILLLLTAPKLLPALENKSNQANVDVIAQNKLIIEDIQVNADIREGDASVLDKGMWHRLPEAGNPEKGGNFILSGHRFKIAATPAEVRDASVLYDIDKLNVGSKIVVHWNGRKYNYTVTKRYKVKPNQVEIEKSTETRMTLYTCTLGGAYDGREVVEASIVE